jgi:plastocyanin
MPAWSRLRTTFALLAVSAACACFSDDPNSTESPPPPPPGPHASTVQALPSIAFSPASITVAVGDTVTFAFGAVPHNVFFDRVAGAPTDIPGVNASTNASRIFTAPGQYAYECRLHPGMRGTVVVTATR